MQVIPLTDNKRDAVLKSLEQIPLFSDLKLQSDSELEELLRDANVIDLDLGEVLVKKGDQGKHFYVLLQGSIDVFGDLEPSTQALNQISGIQLFGVLGAVNGDRRSATLAGSRLTSTQVLAFDYSVFGDLCNFGSISLSTKLKLYRNVVNNTRWKLDIYKKATNDLTLKQELSLYPPFDDKTETIEELQYLAKHAEGLGSLLESWNECTKPNIALPELKIKSRKVPSLFANVKSVLQRKVI
jgi:CRP/FNR family cyclic AMP-dependent transcriptional regulator